MSAGAQLRLFRRSRRVAVCAGVQLARPRPGAGAGGAVRLGARAEDEHPLP